MSVQAIYGNTYSAVRAKVNSILKENLSLDKQHYIILPDNVVDFAKTHIFQGLGEGCTFNVKIVNLVSFAKQFMSVDLPMLTGEQSEIILRSIVVRNCDKLKSFGSIANDDGALSEVLSMLDMLAESNISPQTLVKIGTDIGGVLGEKALNIAFLYEEFYKEIKGKYINKHIVLDNFCRANLNQLIAPSINIYIQDFSVMTAEQLRVISRIEECGCNLHLGVVCNDNSDNKRIYPRFLIDFCKNLQSKGKQIDLIQAGQIDKIKCLLADNLYGYNQSAIECEGESISVKYAENILLEVKGVCREIRKAVVESGYRYKDISIFCPDINAYRRDIVRQFEVFELPYYCNFKNDLIDFAIAKLIVCGIEVLSSGYDSVAVLNLCKNILFCGIEDSNKFDLFIRKYNIDGKQFLADFDYESDNLYEVANGIRSKLVQAVSILDDNEGNFAENIKNYFNFVLGDSGYYQYLDKLKKNDGDNTKHNAELAYAKVLNILECVNNVSEYVDNKQAYQTIASIISKTKVGTNKRGVDSIFITDDKKQIGRTKLLFILGANDGVFVKETSSIGLFSYNEAELLARSNVHFTPSLMDINYNEKFEAVQLLTCGDRVVISYNQMAGDASLICKNVCSLLKKKWSPFIGDSNVIGMSLQNYATKIGTKSNAKQELSNYYGERMRGIATGEQKYFDYLYTKLDGAYNYDNIIKQKDYRYVRPNMLCWSKSEDKVFANVSAVEKYFECPFKFYCDKTLRLKKVEQGGFDIRVTGSFVHRVLEKYFRKYEQFKSSKDDFAKIVRELCLSTLNEKDFIVIKQSQNKNVIENCLFKKAEYVLDKAVQVARRSDFEVASTELTFGFEYSKIPAYQIDVGDKKFFVRGKIDRVDKFGDYVAIIDYKSKSSIKLTPKEVYYGERVQLLIYLNAYISYANAKPFALLYMPMPYSYSKGEDSAVYKYSGFVWNEDSIFEHFDNMYTNERLCSLPLKFSKGEITDKNRLQNRELEFLCEYADKVVAQAISEIESGYIEAKPLNCGNCEYGQICLRLNKAEYQRKKSGSKFVLAKKEGEQNG